jgi:NADH dehydrogenase (ubiquinone) 1 alpha subcomplex subunit 9
MGDLGKLIQLRYDLRDENQISECLKHSDVVYNLVGRNFETKYYRIKQKFLIRQSAQ